MTPPPHRTGSPPRVLWLSNETADRGGQGGQRRQYFQTRCLAEAGVAVTVCTPAGSQSDATLRPFARVVRTRSRIRGRVPVPHERLTLRALAREPWDAIVVAHTESWRRCLPTAIAIGAPLWVDLHNVLGELPDGSRSTWWATEEDILSRAERVSVCSQQEMERLSRQHPSAGVQALQVLTHGVDPGEWSAGWEPGPDPLVKLFGSWEWGPNQRGLQWFLDKVWPKVEVPAARCEIAGSGLDGLALPSGVSYVGRVARLDVWARDAWAMVVPVLEGVGAPLKYLEALAVGAPVLSTLDGAPVLPERASLVSDDPRQWANHLQLLLNAPTEVAGRAQHQSVTWAEATEPLVDWVRQFTRPSR